MGNKILTQMFEKFEKETRTLAENNNSIALTVFKEWKKLRSDIDRIRFIEEVDDFSLIRSSELSHGDHLPEEYKF